MGNRKSCEISWLQKGPSLPGPSWPTFRLVCLQYICRNFPIAIKTWSRIFNYFSADSFITTIFFVINNARYHTHVLFEYVSCMIYWTFKMYSRKAALLPSPSRRGDWSRTRQASGTWYCSNPIWIVNNYLEVGQKKKTRSLRVDTAGAALYRNRAIYDNSRSTLSLDLVPVTRDFIYHN